MTTALVDKGWQEKGLETYLNAAIFGTLAHYGVVLDEAAFVALAAQDYPITIAQGWLEAGWKGTGQFARFPAAAAEELWHRTRPDDFSPTDLALALIKLMQELGRAIDGKDDGTLETRFNVVEAYVPRRPPPGERFERFTTELLVALGEWLDPMDSLAEALARKGKPEAADRFVALEEALFPVRAGAAAALVKAAKGDHDGAVKDLCALGDDATRDPFNRLAVVDALLDLDAPHDAARVTLAVLEAAEARRDFELASNAAERLAQLIQRDPPGLDRAALRARVASLALTFRPSSDE